MLPRGQVSWRRKAGDYLAHPFSSRSISYHPLPNDSPLVPFGNEASWASPRHAIETLRRKTSPRSISLFATIIALLLLTVGLGVVHGVREYGRDDRVRKEKTADHVIFFWHHYPRLNGFFNGVRTLVPYSSYTPDNGYNKTRPLDLISFEAARKLSPDPPLDPAVFDPYPDYRSSEYLAKYTAVQDCYINSEESILPPDVYTYPGTPQNMSMPLFGSYDVLSMEEKVCFERFGRYAPYGYGYNTSQGGLGPGLSSEDGGAGKVLAMSGFINYTNVNWGAAQMRCHEKNKERFGDPTKDGPVTGNTTLRHAFILRVWEGYHFDAYQMYSLRAMISELSLKSGAEYDVHFLLEMKHTPIFGTNDPPAVLIEHNIPREFWNMTTLWNMDMMSAYYPGPFPPPIENHSKNPIYHVYRSAHFPLQWFAQQHPEYDFFWNWEVDMRYTGHYYELTSRLGEWARRQPRKGLWERSAKFYIPKQHGDWAEFGKRVEEDSAASGVAPIWGPVAFEKNFDDAVVQSPEDCTPPFPYETDDHEWGVGEEADLIVLNPLFDPDTTNWVFKKDVTGYTSTPPRRTAIITAARMSKRLLSLAHLETLRGRHSMFPEMWPPSIALHHGLKAVYAPHPVYFDRDWDVANLDQVLNRPVHLWESPFGWGENNLWGSSFYYNSKFSGPLWRRWLGFRENGEGGKREEEDRTGRMCLRSMLFHPIKFEEGEIG